MVFMLILLLLEEFFTVLLFLTVDGTSNFYMDYSFCFLCAPKLSGKAHWPGHKFIFIVTLGALWYNGYTCYRCYKQPYLIQLTATCMICPPFIIENKRSSKRTMKKLTIENVNLKRLVT